MPDATLEMESPPSLWESALADHQAGRLSEAQISYQKLLAREPANADALHMLGVLRFQCEQAAGGLELLDAAIAINGRAASYHGHRGLILASMGRSAEAIEAYRTALGLKPKLADVHNNLGSLLQAGGDVRGAIDAYRRALAAQPKMAEAAVNLGLALINAGEYAEAVAALQNAVSLRPGDAVVTSHLTAAHNNYGTSLEQRGDLRDAIKAFHLALSLNPDFPEARFNLGKSLAGLNQYEEAIGEYRGAISLKPDFAEAHNNLGIALFMRGMVAEAIISYQEALRCRPDYAQALNNLGTALRTSGQIEQALSVYRTALKLTPQNAELWNNLGSALDVRGELEEAIVAFDKAIEIRPGFSQAHNNRGNTQKNLGNLDAALADYQRAIELDPANQEVQSNRLYTLYFHPDYSAEMIYREHQKWNAALAVKHQPATLSSTHAGRRLRIGYVAATFREHCQSFFTVPLFSHHDRGQFEIFAYSDTVAQDAITSRLRGYCDGWRNIAGLSDDAVADMIRHDGIDILVDLSLHMSQNRLMVFARKPAAVQVTWLGYPGTTGLKTIDYRLTDPYLDPATVENDRFYSEKSWRLPRTFWCYDSLAGNIPVSELPAAHNGHITFGCLNNFCKVNDGVLRLWSAVLRQVGNSHMLLLAPRAARLRILETFEQNGVKPSRIEFVDRASRSRYLSFYHRIDIGLDTVPYNGHTTTLDSLWMGVPVITLTGNAPAGRAGWSQLSNIGLEELAAKSELEFVQLAANLSQQTSELAQLRASLRSRLTRSPLMDGARFARDVETAYRAFIAA